MYYIVRKMTQNKVDYSKSLIYKIVCNDTNIKNVYIGSTTSFSDRKRQHKTSCNNENSCKYNYPLYTFIRDNGDWNNWSMILVNYIPCNTKLELLKYEREYIEKIESNLLLNKVIPTRTKKEYVKIYREGNKDKINEYRKQYREANKDKIREKDKLYYDAKKEKIVCDKCGKLSSKNHIKRHQQGNSCIKI